MRRDPEEFDDVFHINVTGVFATIQAFYPLLKVRDLQSAQRWKNAHRSTTKKPGVLSLTLILQC